MSLFTPDDVEFASDKDYEKFTVEGRKLRYLLVDRSSFASQTPSPFNSIDQLRNWGWKDTTVEQMRETSFPTLDHIGWYVGNRTAGWCHWKHMAECEVDDVPELDIMSQTKEIFEADEMPAGAVHRATGAYYYFLIWPSDPGIIVAHASMSPLHMVSQGFAPPLPSGEKRRWNFDNDRLPKLNHWSDVVALSWKEYVSQHGGDLKGLKHVFRRSINNDDTLRILAYVLRKKYPDDKEPGRVPVWPYRRYISPLDEGYDALLYTPNVRGVVWLLAQHRAMFGNKWIRGITAYVGRECETYEPSLRIDLLDVDPT